MPQEVIDSLKNFALCVKPVIATSLNKLIHCLELDSRSEIDGMNSSSSKEKNQSIEEPVMVLSQLKNDFSKKKKYFLAKTERKFV